MLQLPEGGKGGKPEIRRFRFQCPNLKGQDCFFSTERFALILPKGATKNFSFAKLRNANNKLNLPALGGCYHPPKSFKGSARMISPHRTKDATTKLLHSRGDT
jgi:hypothetical protein